jgi:hypothetical protein
LDFGEGNPRNRSIGAAFEGNLELKDVANSSGKFINHSQAINKPFAEPMVSWLARSPPLRLRIYGWTGKSGLWKSASANPHWRSLVLRQAPNEQRSDSEAGGIRVHSFEAQGSSKVSNPFKDERSC